MSELNTANPSPRSERTPAASCAAAPEPSVRFWPRALAETPLFRLARLRDRDQVADEAAIRRLRDELESEREKLCALCTTGTHRQLVDQLERMRAAASALHHAEGGV
jgi:hypothetical protein